MLFAAGLVVLGLALLVAGGEALLRGAVGLATLLKLTPAVIGLTVVAAGTSVPELAVSGIAAYRGSNDIAVANVIGSNIFNIAFIVGLCGLILPFKIVGNTLKLEYPVLLAVSVLCYLLVLDNSVSRSDAGLFLALYIGFTIYLIRLVRKQMTSQEDQNMQSEVEELAVSKQPSWLVSGVLVAVGIALLGLGAQATVEGASQLARLWGWSERMIGLTIVSVGTSLPEIVASVISSVRGRSDVALGNVIGSNIFNILVILGLSGLIAPLSVQSALVNSDCLWMLGVTVLLLPVLVTGRKVSRVEGVLLLTVYGVYLSLLIFKQ